eukprot:605908-Pleurochrysis_carterae.AAC.1
MGKSTAEVSPLCPPTLVEQALDLPSQKSAFAAAAAACHDVNQSCRGVEATAHDIKQISARKHVVLRVFD